MPATTVDRFYGKYRGIVVDNNDPLRLARLQVRVPDVLGTLTSGWALPCLPVAGNGMGVFALPPVGANVWVEFEQGDAAFPVWTGGFWDDASPPPQRAVDPPRLQNVLLQTAGGSSLLITDQPGPRGGIVLRSPGGVSLTLNDTGITLVSGAAKITMSLTTVDINDSALSIT